MIKELINRESKHTANNCGFQFNCTAVYLTLFSQIPSPQCLLKMNISKNINCILVEDEPLAVERIKGFFR